MKTLIIIPARGGSKGVPRKNLRDFAGKPLLFYSIELALAIPNSQVIVNTDDNEIEYFVHSTFSTVEVFRRDSADGEDFSTIDDVVLKQVEQKEYVFDILVVLQPTSPLLSKRTLNGAIEKFSKDDCDSAIAVKKFRHLLWQRDEKGNTRLIQKSRVNRQLLDDIFLETGAVTISRKRLIDQGKRIGDYPCLVEIPDCESIDLDSNDDWLVAERTLESNVLYIYVAGNELVGLGHVYNVLEIANYLASYSITFITTNSDSIARDILKSYNYRVIIKEKEELPAFFSQQNGVRRLILDCLDLPSSLLRSLSEEQVRIVSIEDRNLEPIDNRIVINALYEGKNANGFYFGHEYFVMRREFLNRRRKFSPVINEVLISFGGADPQNYTKLCYEILRKRYEGNITIIVGTANSREYEVDDYTKVLKSVSNIAFYMNRADVVFTSAGRTSLECAAMKLPGLVLNQNEREMEHKFASRFTGFIRAADVRISSEEIENYIVELFDVERRKHLYNQMENIDFLKHTERVTKLIKKHLN